jgi:hypothetical protein
MQLVARHTAPPYILAALPSYRKRSIGGSYRALIRSQTSTGAGLVQRAVHDLTNAFGQD